MTSRRPILLGGYAAKQCARRIHNEWDPTIDVELLPVPPHMQALFDAGRDFESRVREELQSTLGGRCVDIPVELRKPAAIAATERAMDEGVELIIGGWLPDDHLGHRTGRPDLLLRVSEEGGVQRYVPGDIKAHQSTKAGVRGQWPYSTLGDPATVVTAPGRSPRTSDRFDDYIQLVHYTRMLEAMGRAPVGVVPRAFIIGTDPPPATVAGSVVLTWLDLDTPQFTTFSRSRGTARRSACERYDHEYSFRVAVADRARQRTGVHTDPPPLVVPVDTDECDVCPWRDYCREEIGPDAASAILEAGRLDIREWQALAANGVTTAEDLAALELDDEDWWSGYLPEVTHQPKARDRLSTAVTRARMALAGVRLERTTSGSIDIPRGDVEIDFDIEWDTANRVFLWGALVSDDEQPDGEYVDFTALEELDESGERELGDRFLEWLRDVVASAEKAGRTIVVFHYSHPERSHVVRVFGEDESADVLSHFVDLLPIVRANFIGVAGLSIKQVAPEFGFHWRDEDPGGLQAQAWLGEARAATGVERDAVCARLLQYNEDDVRATQAVRRGMRALH